VRVEEAASPAKRCPILGIGHGATMSPVIRAVAASSAQPFVPSAAVDGGTSSAIGSPRFVINTGVRRRNALEHGQTGRLEMRHADGLNGRTDSSMEGYYYGHVYGQLAVIAQRGTGRTS